MEIKSFLIAGGNPTDLIWNCPLDQRVTVAKKYLHKVEQVGFVSPDEGLTRLTMMGDELCVDAILALAFDNGSLSGSLTSPSVDGLISYSNDEQTTIRFRLPYRLDGNTVLFKGVGYLCTEQESMVSKAAAARLAKEYNLPAFGMVLVGDGNISPYVYVAKTGSYIHETGCGSGSMAVSIVTGWEKIKQPSGNVITVRRMDDLFEVTAAVFRQ